ncbi:alpha/beta hydrolase [Cryptosporangium sp. NPDC048952]|uniref:alpha/beta hydrolase n=1 Tax=Cryptosporangium sp. NPDC048952 TaxID=3363961 RepID=UPI003713C5CE
METRQQVSFRSGRDECAAWHYPGTNGACVVMAGGFAVPRGPGTDRFAARFHAAGYSVLAFDYRRLGDSTGEPRLVLPVSDAVADWHAALTHAATLPDVDPTRIAAWAFSMSGGHLFTVAAQHPGLAAAIAQTPNADGLAATRNAARYQSVGALLGLVGRGVVDALGGLLGRAPLTVPTAGARGTVAVLTTPDAADGDRALDPDDEYSEWTRTVAARSTLSLATYRPGRDAAAVRCPLLVVVCDDDQSALAAPAVAAAQRAPRGALVRLTGAHYAPFLDQHEAAVEAELDFLARALTSSTSDRSS